MSSGKYKELVERGFPELPLGYRYYINSGNVYGGEMFEHIKIEQTPRLSNFWVGTVVGHAVAVQDKNSLSSEGAWNKRVAAAKDAYDSAFPPSGDMYGMHAP